MQEPIANVQGKDKGQEPQKEDKTIALKRDKKKKGQHKEKIKVAAHPAREGLDLASVSNDQQSFAQQEEIASQPHRVRQLPSREHSLGTLLSFSSNMLTYSSMLLGNFDSAGAKTARAICNSVGFFGKQAHDSYLNKRERDSITNLKKDLLELYSDEAALDLDFPFPTRWQDNFGLELSDVKIVLTTMLNIGLQLAVTAFSCYDAYKHGEHEFIGATQFKILFTALMLITVALDHLEQHYKSDNLRRRKEQLKDREDPKLAARSHFRN